ncbi:hypothetical protein DNTS_028267 [Danionella cerebrum]|uniref:Centrosomal protein of 68 kDa n=1 Tax=Danionella cerebrum TaxID=2873325 RepID=A0A553QDJ8_9TELE|nr:hypothetical protein DNTS_028267 [Danionella translucida]
MENKGCGRWRSRHPEITCSSNSRYISQSVVERTRLPNVPEDTDFERNRTGTQKTVTLAPVSTYMMDKGLYTMRKPLTTSQCQIPILKNSSVIKDSEVRCRINPSTEKEEVVSKQTFTSPTEVSSCYKSSTTFLKEDLDSSMTLLELRGLSNDKDPIFNTSAAKHSPSISLSSSLSLLAPPVPKWTSSPRSSSQLSLQSSHWTGKVKNKRGEFMHKPKDSLTRSSQYLGNTYPQRFKHMSPHQANYWACTIPTSMPPSPNRRSPSWDPEREYQELLDYTYPLRPNMLSMWSSLGVDNPLITDPMLQDSGIELDRICSSSTLSSWSQRGTQLGQRNLGVKRSEFHALNPSHFKSSDGAMSSSLYSSTGQTGCSLESLDGCTEQRGHCCKGGIFSKFGSAPSFISSTRVLPLSDSLDDLDEEFLRLPEQLEELQVLSQHLRDISEHMSQAVTTSLESLESRITSVRSPTVTFRAQEQFGEERCDEEKEHVSGVPLVNKAHLDKLKESVSRIQMISQDMNRRNLREVEAVVDRLGKLSISQLHETIRTGQEENETKASLVQCLQPFCSNLEELIQWLHTVVEKVEVLSPPEAELESVKASLADFKSFQEDVQAHKPLTADVVQTGEMLLRCMDSTTPFLKDTLQLIETQSHTLEIHSEYLFSSILSAMDCLTDPRSEEASDNQVLDMHRYTKQTHCFHMDTLLNWETLMQGLAVSHYSSRRLLGKTQREVAS